MHISVSDAKAQLTDLVRRAEAGDEVILTRRGAPAVRLVPIVADDVRPGRRQALDAFFGALKAHPGLEGTSGATMADFLYDESGLPA